jgi:hypothetical protein
VAVGWYLVLQSSHMSGPAPADHGLSPNLCNHQNKMKMDHIGVNSYHVARSIGACWLDRFPCPEVWGLISLKVQQNFEPAHIGHIRGATWHPMIRPYFASGLATIHPVSYLVDRHVNLPTHLPSQHYMTRVKLRACHLAPHHSAILYCQSLGQCHVTATCHMYYHVSDYHWATSAYELPRQRLYSPRVKSVLCQLSLKMPNPPNTCHLLVLSHVPTDVIMMSY